MEKSIPAREEVPSSDTWNLGSLFPSDAAWDEAMLAFGEGKRNAEDAKVNHASSSEAFLKALSEYAASLELDERLGYYAHLKVAQDLGNSDSQGRFARYLGEAAACQAAWSWLSPAVQALPGAFIDSCLGDARFADYRIFLERLLRFKPHVLPAGEERLLALQAETNGASQEAFSALTNVDMQFGAVKTGEGKKPLSQSSLAVFLRNPDRKIRKNAYRKFYAEFDAHKNTIASLFATAVRQTRYQAKVRGFEDSLAAALFPDNVPRSVYDNLIDTVHRNLPSLHRYYRLRRSALKLRSLAHYDVYVPLVSQSGDVRRPYDQAVETVCSALAPLGGSYVATLREGLTSGWVDRYENKGKRSGAFSAGTFRGDPYILLNYKEDLIHDLFTMAHEAGHSMHSWHSARSNPFLSYNYTIFEAEVASTFNEQLLFDHLYRNSTSDGEKAYLLSTRIDDTIGTLFRQTMFAEYEKLVHGMAEEGKSLTVDSLRSTYRGLLEKYFGPGVEFEPESDMEGLRIPHFYTPFYVYKYATGLSASIALSARVLGGGASELEDYYGFLRSGGSRFPIESLRKAGVDMTSSEPVQLACDRFAADVERLSSLI